MSEFHSLELFGRDFKSKGMIAYDPNEQDIVNDYLTLTSSTITVPKKINVNQGDYVYSDLIQGVVSAVEFTKGFTTVTYLPLLSLLDVDVMFNKNDVNSESLIASFAAVIKHNFVDNADVTQNIQGLVVRSFTNDAKDSTLLPVNEIGNIFEHLKTAFIKHRLCAVMTLNPAEKQIVLELNCSTRSSYIYAERPYVQDADVFIKPYNGGVNKLVAYWTYHFNGEEIASYAIKRNNNQQVSVPVAEFIDGETIEEFREKAESRAAELFAYDDSANFISLVIDSDSKLYPDLQLGDLCTVFYEGEEYTSLLTKTVRRVGLTEFVFGCIRLDLTDILQLQY